MFDPNELIPLSSIPVGALVTAKNRKKNYRVLERGTDSQGEFTSVQCIDEGVAMSGVQVLRSSQYLNQLYYIIEMPEESPVFDILKLGKLVNANIVAKEPGFPVHGETVSSRLYSNGPDPWFTWRIVPIQTTHAPFHYSIGKISAGIYIAIHEEITEDDRERYRPVIDQFKALPNSGYFKIRTRRNYKPTKELQEVFYDRILTVSDDSFLTDADYLRYADEIADILIEAYRLYHADLVRLTKEYYTIKSTTTQHSPHNNQLRTQSPQALNQILYGPPGTGKTYATRALAVAIIDGKRVEDLGDDRAAINARYRELEAAGKICFTTFHQSMSYEDFVEGIKPDTTSSGQVVYRIVDGILKQAATAAATAEVIGSTSEYANQDFERRWSSYKDLIEQGNREITTVFKGNRYRIAKVDNNEIFFTKLDAEKTTEPHSVRKESLRAMHEKGAFEAIADSRRLLNFGLQSITARGQHVPLAAVYRDFFNATEGADLAQYVKLERRNTVLIIDEINRGNVSAIFGELITLIEDGKRTGQDEAITVTLPYSKEPFSLPSNLYIIGTMNTADRSVEALDTALRRRFSFREMLPQPELLSPPHKSLVEGIDLGELLTAINDRLIALKDTDHTIGHAFLINCDTLDKVKAAFSDKILPLLQEFFYGDLAKVARILGRDWVKPVSDNPVHLLPGYDDNDSPLPRYRLVNKADVVAFSPDQFTAIYRVASVAQP